MEALELKHLAPYLPYGLKFATLNDDTEKYYINEERHILECGGLNGVANICMAKYSRPIYRIILIPLSDLLNEDLEYLLHNHSTDYFADTDNEKLIKNCLKNNTLQHYIEFLPNGLVEWLVSEHYDIFGLIEKGLAIDINTL